MIKRNVKILGFRLNDTTALLIFLISIGVLFSGGIGLLIVMTLPVATEYLSFMYVAYAINIGIGVWLLKKSLKYKKIRK